MDQAKFFHQIAVRRLIAVIAIVIIGSVAGLLILHKPAASPVPADIRKAVSFPVYYPDSSQLPAGYALDSSSFRQAQPGVIVYSITHSGSQPLAVSEENQPGGSVISDFIKNYIPLHNTVDTDLGSAQVGVYGKAPNQQAVASLQIKNGPWLLITAPSGVKQTDLDQILQALKR